MGDYTVIPQADQLQLLIGLLKRFSPSGQELSASKYLVSQMRQLGFNSFVDDIGNAVGILGDGAKEIVLLGHIDTVPGYIDVHLEGDKLWGRGAVDAKGSLACFVAAAAQVGVRSGWKFTVIGAVGEEDDGRGARFIRPMHKPAYLVIGEPSGWDRVTLGYKGDAFFWYIVRRAVTHTATQMESACEAAVNFWNRVSLRCAEINQGKLRIFDHLVPYLRSINSSTDGFTETAQITISLRLPIGFSLEDLEEEFNALAQDGTVELIRGDPAYKAEKNTPLVRSFLSAIRKSGGQPAFVMKTGTSDMNTVAPYWNCPTLAYGPGDSILDHTLDEHILISDYQKSVQILGDALWNLTSE
jgi:LysW-gamma-L-lysine carboxypeptidase